MGGTTDTKPELSGMREKPSSCATMLLHVALLMVTFSPPAAPRLMLPLGNSGPMHSSNECCYLNFAVLRMQAGQDGSNVGEECN